MAQEMRIQKYLSKAGVCSRRTAEEWMLEGRIKVNGTACRELGTKVTPGKDRVDVDGQRIDLPESHIYVLLNKPAGYITSLEDPQGRPVVTDLLPKNMPRVWPVGRLDWNTEGLLLMTDDGKLTHLLTHPAHDVHKHYAVKVRGLIEEDSPVVHRLRDGLDIGGGEVTQPAFVRVTSATDRNTWLEVIIAEGKNRQVRRMFEATGHMVMKLRRIGIGPLSIEGLPSGSFRPLNHDEVQALYAELGAELPERAEPSKRQLKRERRAQDRPGKRDVRRVSRGRSKRKGKKP